MIWRVIPAMRDGSPRSRSWSAALNQFQHFEEFADFGCPGYATRKPCSSARSFMRVPAAKSSGDWVHPWSITMSDTVIAARNVELVAPSARLVRVRTLLEPRPFSQRRGCGSRARARHLRDVELRG